MKGARTHNLKNIEVEIPRDSLTVITGLSGSGKSSLAFDTLYAEGQRRYVESLSAYARQFLSMMEKPDVDLIEGLSPAISIEQKSTSHNPRSTVGTITEIYDYLRLLFARVGEPRCPDHDLPLASQTISSMVDQISVNFLDQRVMVLAPMVDERKGEHLHLFNELRGNGFVRVRVNGIVTDLDNPPALDKKKKHSIEAVIDRLRISEENRQRLAETLETAAELSGGIILILNVDASDSEPTIFSTRFACTECGYSLSELEPRMFSFNNPAGACSACDGLGVSQNFDEKLVVVDDALSLAEGAVRGWDRRNVYYFHLIKRLAKHYEFSVEDPFRKLSKTHRRIILFGSSDEKIDFSYRNDRGEKISRRHKFEGVIPNMQRRLVETESNLVRESLQKFLKTDVCSACQGSRLKRESRHVFIDDLNISDLTNCSTSETLSIIQKFDFKGQKAAIADKILKEIKERLSFLIDVGLNYLTLERSADTLSGGEAQRIRLASQIGAGLVGVMYILDEPSIGLHQRDNERLLRTLENLRNLGNTVLIVEHDEEAIRRADYIIDVGPGAGVHGGTIVAQGRIDDILTNPKSITGQFLSGDKKIITPKKRRDIKENKFIEILEASGNNLKKVTLRLPCGLFNCITGVSGSGKSTLINNTLYPIAATSLNKATTLTVSEHSGVNGLEHLDKVIAIDQSPIGRTPRSNPATYTGLFTPIRELFAQVAEARTRGYKPGRFSFNVKGGRCESCEGDGEIKVEMHFLPNIYVTCDECKGKRYNKETLDIRYKGKNIAEVLDMTIEEAGVFFEPIPAISAKLQTIIDVGLGYIKLGQSAVTLSGGEAQRIKLSKELSKRGTGNTLYILDEPTTGLHFQDINTLLEVLHRLTDQGNTLVVIEHNLDVIKTADWIVDLGPEGGSGGGEIIAEGTPEQIAKSVESHTGRFLKNLL